MEYGKTLVEVAEQQLIAMILEQNMQPGDKLPNEYDLATSLGIGRSTLREAIRRLVARNVLRVRQGAGTFVSHKNGIPEDPLGLTFLGGKDNDPKLALDMLNVRLMLEPEICAQVASSATSAQLEQLQTYYLEADRLITAGEDYSQADAQMHSHLAHCSGNRVLRNLLPIITTSVHASIVSTQDEHRLTTKLQHQLIITAILRRDSVGARNAMISHLNTSRESVLLQVKNKSKVVK